MTQEFDQDRTDSGSSPEAPPAGSRAHARTLQATKRKDRGGFLIGLGVEIERAARYERPLSLALIRLQNTKRSHASIWYTQRKAMLAELHNSSIDLLRLPDFSARIAENGFAICLPETDLSGAETAVKKFLEQKRITALRTRFSIGGVGLEWRAIEWSQSEALADEMIARVTALFNEPCEQSVAPADSEPVE